MTSFKKIWNDLSTLSRFHFACKYIFPFFAIFLTWGCLGNFYQTRLGKSELVEHVGQVHHIGVRFEQGTRSSYKYYPLKISLENFTDEFSLRDEFEDRFSLLQDKIHMGDTITIYTRTSLQTMIGWGQKNDIYQIEKGSEVLFPASVAADYNANQAKILLLMALLFWTPFVLFRLKVIHPK